MFYSALAPQNEIYGLLIYYHLLQYLTIADVRQIDFPHATLVSSNSASPGFHPHTNKMTWPLTPDSGWFIEKTQITTTGQTWTIIRRSFLVDKAPPSSHPSPHMKRNPHFVCKNKQISIFFLFNFSPQWQMSRTADNYVCLFSLPLSLWGEKLLLLLLAANLNCCQHKQEAQDTEIKREASFRRRLMTL